MDLNCKPVSFYTGLFDKWQVEIYSKESNIDNFNEYKNEHIALIQNIQQILNFFG